MSTHSQAETATETTAFDLDGLEAASRELDAQPRPCYRCGARRVSWYHARVADPVQPAVVQFCLCARCAERHLLAVVREYLAETEKRITVARGRRFSFAPRAPVIVCVGTYREDDAR